VTETSGLASVMVEPRTRRFWPIALVIGIAAAFSLALGWYQLLGMGEWHQYLEYDDGVWFGTSVRLAHGILPYRSFVDDQPPGVPVLMLPFALWSRSVGTRTAFAAARLVVPLVETMGVLALGWTVRHRRTLTVAVACGVMAVYPLCLIDQRTVMLEPFCATLCLLGVAAVFDGDCLSTRTGRLVAAGVFFGLAGSCKAFALLPFAAIVAGLAASSARSRLVPFLAATAAAFGAVCGPFALLAPGAFLHDVVVTQFTRTGVAEPSLYDRLASLVASPPSTVPTGLSDHRDRVVAVVVAIAIGVLVVGSYAVGRSWSRRPGRRGGQAKSGQAKSGQAKSGQAAPGWLTPLDATAVLIVVVTGTALVQPAAYYYHYAAFFGPFLALMLGLAGGRAGRRAPLVVSMGAAVVLGVGAVHAVQTVRGSPGGWPDVALIDELVPPGACVLGDDAPTLVLADRFSSSEAGCTAVTDAFGTTISSDGGYPASTPLAQSAKTVGTWLDALEHSNYVVLALGFHERRIPWDAPALRLYVRAHFEPLPAAGYVILRRRSPPGPVAPLRGSHAGTG
jgi:alpha-1,2-mannosyltransferase